MSGFTAGWLHLREPYDAAARSRQVLEPLVRWSESRASIRVLDLGGGTGSNLRFLAPRLNARQAWTIFDNDAALLANVRGAVGVSIHVCDIARGFDWLDRDGVDLVTASALLDLVSAAWLDALLAHCRSRQIAVHFALTYNGVLRFDPPDADDGIIRDRVNRHQLRDKGFGPALGPGAAAHAVGMLRRLGYAVSEDESAWHLLPKDGRLQRTLLDGWAAAALETDSTLAGRITGWHARRSARVRSGASTITVGHVDMTALP